MTAVLAILKFAGIGMAGCFALLGLLVEYKDKTTGKINQIPPDLVVKFQAIDIVEIM